MNQDTLRRQGKKMNQQHLDRQETINNEPLQKKDTFSQETKEGIQSRKSVLNTELDL